MGKPQSQQHNGSPYPQHQSHGGVHCFFHIVKSACAIGLGNDHRGAGRDAHKQIDEEIDEHTGGAAHGGQGLFAHKVAHDHGVSGVIELLKKGA